MVETPQLHSAALPRVEVGSCVDGTTRSQRVAYAPELGKRITVTFHGRGVVTHRVVDVVGGTVGVHGSPVLTLGPVGPKFLDDVVLHERVRGPPVQAQVADAARVEAAREINDPTTAVAPTLTENAITDISP